MNYEKQKQKCINYGNGFERIFTAACFTDTVKSIISWASNHLSLYTVDLIYLLFTQCLTNQYEYCSLLFFSWLSSSFLSFTLKVWYSLNSFLTTSQRSDFIAALPNLKYLLISSVPNTWAIDSVRQLMAFGAAMLCWNDGWKNFAYLIIWFSKG